MKDTLSATVDSTFPMFLIQLLVRSPSVPVLARVAEILRLFCYSGAQFPHFALTQDSHRPVLVSSASLPAMVGVLMSQTDATVLEPLCSLMTLLAPSGLSSDFPNILARVLIVLLLESLLCCFYNEDLVLK